MYSPQVLHLHGETKESDKGIVLKRQRSRHRLLHVERRHQTDSKLAIFGLADARDFRRIKIRWVVFLRKDKESKKKKIDYSDKGPRFTAVATVKRFHGGVPKCVFASLTSPR